MQHTRINAISVDVVTVAENNLPFYLFGKAGENICCSFVLGGSGTRRLVTSTLRSSNHALSLIQDLVQSISNGHCLISNMVTASLTDNDLFDTLGLVVPVRTSNLTLKSTGSDNFRAGKVSLCRHISHSALEIPVRCTHTNLARLKETSTEANAGTASRRKRLSTSIKQDLPIASLLSNPLLRKRCCSNVELDTGRNFGGLAILGSFTEDTSGGSKI